MKTHLLIAISILLAACGSEPTGKQARQTTQAPAPSAPAPVTTEAPKAEPLPAGKVLSRVKLQRDASQHFTLYLPKDYAPPKRYPIILFFDPQGEGAKPVELYSKLADKHGVILAGSGNARNGIDMPTLGGIATKLLDDCLARLSVDTQRVTFAGFSGGAKLAILAGGADMRVTKIIYCGAVTQFQPSHPVALMGFAGTRDMNYTDLVSFERDLGKFPFPHLLVEWKGEHKWPTANVFNDAFTFVAKGMVENYKAKGPTISQANVQKEQEEKRKFIEGFQNKDLDWWQNEIGNLQLRKANDIMAERLLGFISLACYSITQNAMKNNDLRSADIILTIYGWADPENEGYKEFKAEYERKAKR